MKYQDMILELLGRPELWRLNDDSSGMCAEVKVDAFNDIHIYAEYRDQYKPVKISLKAVAHGDRKVSHYETEYMVSYESFYLATAVYDLRMILLEKRIEDHFEVGLNALLSKTEVKE